MDFEAPVPLEEEEAPEAADPLAALTALARQQQAQREAALARLRALSQQQAGQAQGARGLSVVASFGQNPLLQGLQRTAEGQSGQLQGMAERTGAQAMGLERGGGIDPLGIARLAQMAEYQKGQQELGRDRLEQQKALAEAARIKAAAGAAGKARTAEEKRAEKLWKDAESMRKEFTNLPDVKEFAPFENAYKGLRAALAKPGGVGSTAAIFNFMKLIDPGVAVMEGDVERIRASAGPAAKFADLYEYAKSGNTLPATVRSELEAMAGELYAIRKERYEERRKQYEGLAKKRGVDPGDVLPPSTSAISTPQRIPVTQALPPGPGGSLLLGTAPAAQAPATDTVRVKINGKERPIPRNKVEAFRARAAERQETFEVIDG